MSTVGLAIKSSGQINSVEQLRLWSPTGINVQRLIEGDTKPSNLFADLVYYLLTSKSQGVGNVVPSELIDTDSLRIAAQFQRANQIFYDGVVEESESFRSFLYDNAALQLCNFTIKNGRFGMMPALPYDSSYQISTQHRQGGHLARIAVLPSEQGRGLGEGLAREALHFFQARGVRLVTVNTQADNHRSLRLYRRLGFDLFGYDVPVWTLAL